MSGQIAAKYQRDRKGEIKRNIIKSLRKRGVDMKSIRSRNTKRLSYNLRSVAIAFLFLVFICSMTADPVCGADTVHVNISATVKWNTKPPEAEEGKRSGLIRWSEGALNYSVSGTMIRDDANSPVVSKKGQFFRPALRYKAQSMFAKYSYDERFMSNDKYCPLVHEYHGRGGGDITESTRLSINLFSSMTQSFLKNLSPAQKQFAAQMQQSMTVPDYYEFVAGGPGATGKLQGKVQTPKPGERCSYRSAEKSIPGFSIGLAMKLPQSGLMEGTRTWSAEAKTDPPPFKMGIYEVGKAAGKKPLTPPEGGKKNVTYTVRWHIGDQLVVPPDVVTEEDKDCEEMRNQINWLEATVKAWEDRSLRNDIRNKSGNTSVNEYQDAVRKKVGEQFPNPDTGKPAKTESLMETDPHCESDEKCGPGENEPTIDVMINGQSVHLYTYDASGNVVSHDVVTEQTVREGWQENQGGKVGASNFDGCMEHEKAHVSDFVHKGYPDTLDKYADFELNALKNQLKQRYKDLEDMGC